MDFDDVASVILMVGLLAALALLWFVIGIVIAYATGWMLEHWFGWLSVNYDLYRTFAVAVIVFAGLRVTSSNKD